MHTLLDYDCLLPEFVNITDGKRSDNKATFDIEIKPHSIVVADRGYCDYGLLNQFGVYLRLVIRDGPLTQTVLYLQET